MIKFDIRLKDNSIEHATAYDIADNYFPDINSAVIFNRKKSYNTIILTFDIETTTYIDVDGVPHAYMYQWQMGINDVVYFGRTWRDWLILLKNIRYHYQQSDEKFICYVHFLSFEYQFMRDFLPMFRVFAMKAHKVLTCETDWLEFRCSFILSNMSLEKWTSVLPIKYLKRKDNFDYDVLRTPTTPLTPAECEYCYIDVRALYECIKFTLQNDNDTLLTIPLTSTGYVRRHCKEYLRQNPQNWYDFNKCKLTAAQYAMCKQAFRGGNTSANRYYVNQIITHVGSYDKKSSYPYQMYSKQYPQGQFMLIKSPLITDIDDCYAWLISVRFTGLDIKSSVPIPYLSLHKCAVSDDNVICNGRVLFAAELETVCTEIDLQIIVSQYDFDNIVFGICYRCKKRPLPPEYIASMLYWFDRKCDLECDEDDEDYYYYTKAKNSVNSYYGMFVSDIVHADIVDKSMVKIQSKDKLIKSWSVNAADVDSELSRHYASRNQFLHYAKGIWVTAYARMELQEIIDITGNLTLYIDTDSDKFMLGINDDEIIEQVNVINARISKDGYTRINRKGEIITLGVWEREKNVRCFKTLGAKKYYCEYADHNKITVSGLSKKNSIKDIDTIDKFCEGHVVPPDLSGRTAAYYHDVGIHYININGERILTASNLAVLKSDYTLSISDTLIDFISKL